jgi:hypothetical protein
MKKGGEFGKDMIDLKKEVPAQRLASPGKHFRASVSP